MTHDVRPRSSTLPRPVHALEAAYNFIRYLMRGQRRGWIETRTLFPLSVSSLTNMNSGACWVLGAGAFTANGGELASRSESKAFQPSGPHRSPDQPNPGTYSARVQRQTQSARRHLLCDRWASLQGRLPKLPRELRCYRKRQTNIPTCMRATRIKTQVRRA